MSTKLFKKKYRSRLEKLDKIKLSEFPKGFHPTIINKTPYIVKLRRLLNTEEIEELLKMAEGKYEKSTIVVDGKLVTSDVRTSETAYITENGHHDKYSKPIENILKKICYLTKCKRHQIEGLMVVKYEKNQQYYDHHDYFKKQHVEMISDGGQRIATFFCYLTSLEINEGGETEFPQLGIKIKPSKGTGVFWWNTNEKGKTLSKTLHRGNPVDSDKIKYGLNIWVRQTGWKM